jgi:hypothetical protein
MTKLTTATRKKLPKSDFVEKAPENIPSLMPLTHEMLWRGARESRSTPLSLPQLSENFQK